MLEPCQTDLSLLLALNGDGGGFVDALMYYASARLTWIPLYALLIWAVWRKYGTKNLLRFLAVVVVMVLIADQIANLGKTYLSKFRPTHYPPLEGMIHTVNDYRGGLYGTISSHAANSVALMILCGTILRRWWIWLGLGLWVALVSYSRIYLGVHYPFDIAFGLIEGSIVGLAAAYTYKKIRTLDSQK